MLNTSCSDLSNQQQTCVMIISCVYMSAFSSLLLYINIWVLTQDIRRILYAIRRFWHQLNSLRMNVTRSALCQLTTENLPMFQFVLSELTLQLFNEIKFTKQILNVIFKGLQNKISLRTEIFIII